MSKEHVKPNTLPAGLDTYYSFDRETEDDEDMRALAIAKSIKEAGNRG